MPTNVIMPQMGESIAEGTLTRWLKKIGDSVKRDEPLFEISTDKVDAEIPSPAAGVLLEILVTEGTTVPINTVVAKIGEAGEATGPPKRAEEIAPAPVVEAPRPPRAFVAAGVGGAFGLMPKPALAPFVIVGARVVPSIKLSLAGSWFFEQTTEGTIGAKVSGGSIGPRVTWAALARDEIELVLQINGKVRGKLVVPATADRAAIEAAALASDAFARHAEGRAAKKVVVVPGRLANVVV